METGLTTRGKSVKVSDRTSKLPWFASQLMKTALAPSRPPRSVARLGTMLTAPPMGWAASWAEIFGPIFPTWIGSIRMKPLPFFCGSGGGRQLGTRARA